MLFAWCALLVVSCVLVAGYALLVLSLVMCCLLFAIVRCVLFVVCWLWFLVWCALCMFVCFFCLLFGARFASLVVDGALRGVCCLLFVVVA